MSLSTQIENHLINQAFITPYQLFHFETMPSTNDFLKTHPLNDTLTICIADAQTHGHGRFGRVWHSPKCGNLYFSIRITLPKPPSQLSSLSLVVGLSVLNAFKKMDMQYPFTLKWPNDVMWEDKKFGGILIEVTNSTEISTTLIIGIGLNLVSVPMETNIEKPVTALNLIHSEPIDKATLISTLIYVIVCDLKEYVHWGWGNFEAQWQQVDHLYDKEIKVRQLGKTLSGKAKGVNNKGELIIEDNQQQHHVVSSGDTTCQPNL